MHRRERTAYQQFVPALGDRAPQLLGHDDELRTLVTTVLPGEVVRGHRREHSPQVHRQAGGLYRVLHDSAEPTTDPSYTAAMLNRTRRWLDSCREHQLIGERRMRAAWDMVAEAAHQVDLPLVPSHQDSSPRNWLVDDAGTVRLIDFGHVTPHPWCRELVKMQLREWLERLELEEAFLDGYGRRPDAAEEAFMAAARAQEAIGIIWWSPHHDDPAFAAAGHRALEHVLERQEAGRGVSRQRPDGPSASPPR